MSFLGSPIVAGTVWPSVLTGIFSYQSHSVCVFIFILSLVTTVLPCPLELTSGLLTNHQCFDLYKK